MSNLLIRCSYSSFLQNKWNNFSLANQFYFIFITSLNRKCRMARTRMCLKCFSIECKSHKSLYVCLCTLVVSLIFFFSFCFFDWRCKWFSSIISNGTCFELKMVVNRYWFKWYSIYRTNHMKDEKHKIL